MRTYALNPNTWVSVGGGSLCIPGQPVTYGKFQSYQDTQRDRVSKNKQIKNIIMLSKTYYFYTEPVTGLKQLSKILYFCTFGHYSYFKNELIQNCSIR